MSFSPLGLGGNFFMKRFAYIVLGTILTLGIVMTGLYFYTTSKSPFGTAVISTENGINVKVEYCQPSKNGREIFGKLVPYNKVWRTGANTSTTIIFEQDTKLAGKDLKKGTYSLFTIPTAEKWTIIINKTIGDWGAFSYKQENDILRVHVPVTTTETVRERFNINLESVENGVNMVFAWDKTVVKLPLTK